MTLIPFDQWLWLPSFGFWLVALVLSTRMFLRYSRREKLATMVFDVTTFLTLAAFGVHWLPVQVFFGLYWILTACLCLPLLRKHTRYERIAIISLDGSLIVAVSPMLFWHCVDNTLVNSLSHRASGSVIPWRAFGLATVAVIFSWLSYCAEKRGARASHRTIGLCRALLG